MLVEIKVFREDESQALVLVERDPAFDVVSGI